MLRGLCHVRGLVCCVCVVRRSILYVVSTLSCVMCCCVMWHVGCCGLVWCCKRFEMHHVLCVMWSVGCCGLVCMVCTRFEIHNPMFIALVACCFMV